MIYFLFKNINKQKNSKKMLFEKFEMLFQIKKCCFKITKCCFKNNK